jgi:hypothetical protein
MAKSIKINFINIVGFYFVEFLMPFARDYHPTKKLME